VYAYPPAEPFCPIYRPTGDVIWDRCRGLSLALCFTRTVCTVPIRYGAEGALGRGRWVGRGHLAAYCVHNLSVGHPSEVPEDAIELLIDSQPVSQVAAFVSVRWWLRQPPPHRSGGRGAPPRTPPTESIFSLPDRPK